jgi:ankyrin repeat protein
MTSLMAALDNGANVSSVDLSAESRTALFYACTRFDDSAAVQTLLEAGADPNHEDTVGCRPLHFASEVCAPKIVELLINAGAERNVQNLVGLPSRTFPSLSRGQCFPNKSSIFFAPLQVTCHVSPL